VLPPLLRIYCVDGRVITLYSNTQQGENNKDNSLLLFAVVFLNIFHLFPWVILRRSYFLNYIDSGGARGSVIG
jgi:hypothetical protein